jgi:histidinol-phosphatase (PHP family)
MNLWDYHLHLENGTFTMDWLTQFWQQGEKIGLIELGFSEHAYRFKQTKGLLTSEAKRGDYETEHSHADLNEYFGLLEEARRSGLNIKTGLEVDYIPEKEKEIREFLKAQKLDYVIGSVHWLGDWGFDIPEMSEEWNRRDVLEVYKEYFSILQKAASSGMFSIIGHPDVIKVFGYRPDADITDLYNETAAVFKRVGVAAEVSTAGFRKPVGEIYPAPVFLKILADQGVPVLINSDAHHPSDVGKYFDKALDLVKSYGFDSLCRFEKGVRKEVMIK